MTTLRSKVVRGLDFGPDGPTLPTISATSALPKKHRMHAATRQRKALLATPLILLAIVGISSVAKRYNTPRGAQYPRSRSLGQVEEAPSSMLSTGPETPTKADAPPNTTDLISFVTHQGPVFQLPIDTALNMSHTEQLKFTQQVLEGCSNTSAGLLKAFFTGGLVGRQQFESLIHQLKSTELEISSKDYSNEVSSSPQAATTSSVRLLVGVTSACCTAKSFERRAAIRATWASLARERYPDVVAITFFISQPPNEADLRSWSPSLKVRLHALYDIPKCFLFFYGGLTD